MAQTILCEPILDPPYKLNLEELKRSFREEKEALKKLNAAKLCSGGWAADEKPKIYVEKDFIITPRIDNFEPFKDEFLLEKNEYLRLEWNAFLAKKEWLQEPPTTSSGEEPKIIEGRRKTLNGKFYGVDNKLAPIPSVPRSQAMRV